MCYFLSSLIWTFAFLFLLAKRRCYKIAKLGKITIVPWKFFITLWLFASFLFSVELHANILSCVCSKSIQIKTLTMSLFMWSYFQNVSLQHVFMFHIFHAIAISHFNVFKKRPHCSIVLSSNLSDRYNLKDQFHINKRLHFWCKLFIVRSCSFFQRMKEIWVDHKIKFFFSPHHFLVLYRITARYTFVS